MSTTQNPIITDIESRQPRRQRRRRHRSRRRPSVAGSGETTTDGSLCFSDSDAAHSWHSTLGSTAAGSFDECGFQEIEGVLDPHIHKESHEVDLESGELEMKVHSGKEQRDCRICHLSLVGDNADHESGIAIELGCSCKGDLAAAHKHCAETWFKIKGNTTCEICGATALNVVAEQTNEANGATENSTSELAGPVNVAETRNFWHGRRVMNILLACMVFAFVISWLFHFNVIT